MRDDRRRGGGTPTPVTPVGRADIRPTEEDDDGMTTSLNSATPPAPTRRRKRHAGHIVAIVAGCLTIFPAFGLLAGGSAVAIAQAVATDDDGYFTVTLERIETDGVAVATSDLWLDDVEGDASPWVLDWLDLDLRLRVEGAATTDEVFVGIARAVDVEDYLAGSDHSEVIELDDRTPRYRQVAGTDTIAAPLDQDFWNVSVVGDGEQELIWEARGGRWAVVVMNADGTPDVAADVQVGARSGAVTPIAVTMIVFGALGTATAIALIVIGARGRKVLDQPESGAVDGSPLPPPSPDTAVRLDEHRSETPVG